MAFKHCKTFKFTGNESALKLQCSNTTQPAYPAKVKSGSTPRPRPRW